jgi:hypothetical protein
LAGTAYVALAAAAFSGAPYFHHVLWTVTICLCLYALLVCVASRWRQPFFAGFVLFAATYLAVLNINYRRLPTTVAIEALGFYVNSDGYIFVEGQSQAIGLHVLRTVNAVGITAAGLIGGALATLAYRRHGKRE